MSFLGGLIGATGTLQAGKTAAAVGDYNAAVSRQNAQQALTAAQTDAALQDTQVMATMGEATARYGAAGVETAGSPLAVMSSIASQGALQRRLTLYNGQVKANADIEQAAVDTAQGKATAAAAPIQATGTLLTSAANDAFAAYKINPYKVFG